MASIKLNRLIRKTYSLLLASSLLCSANLWAHGGEDHAAESPVKTAAPQLLAERAQRLADGSLYLPKALQFLWQVRTTQARSGQSPQFVQLPATVVLNPASEGLVEAAQFGRLTAGPAGFPQVGQQVRTGEVLAYLQPEDSTLDRSNQQALLAELSTQIRLTEDRIKRLGRLGALAAQSELDNAQVELAGLQQRYQFAQKATGKLLPVVAPVSGTISQLHVRAGQYVQIQQALFLILHADSILIEALSYVAANGRADDATSSNAARVALHQQLLSLTPGSAASAQSLDGQLQWSLQLNGVAPALRQQALPLYFQLRTAAASAASGPVDASAGPAAEPALVLGQALQVQLALPAKQPGILLPASALQRQDSGEQAVWLKTAAEQFILQPVRARPAAAGQVLIESGLASNALVVVQGGHWLMQVR